MASTHRMLRILGLFSLERPVIKPEWLMQELGVSRASIYRDLGQLTRAGLLESVAERGYVLGPMVIELDRQIRLSDPLLEAAQELPAKLAEDTGGTILLCRQHGTKVLCIHQVNGRNPALSVSYERGRAMPLYRGATSKIILACLPPAELRQLWTAERQTLVAAGLPDDYAQLTHALAQLRQTGHCVTQGEVDPDAVGFAVPLRDGEHLLGSLSVVMPAAMLTAAQRRSTLSRLQSAAGRIEGRLQDQRDKARATRKTEAP
ncbi:DNA-binding protein [Rhodoferax koreense]|uniref:DNA-binding protein n=1 Tax=Rhodoferax koreensis TaxID=1842727 RepID=A0A1P8K0T2_9BURK|nr:IclR family transcriptional regulator [Rhodoferax koreense]APW39608.1 DNA-binding protein [Rhodoferax koreense]